MFRFFLDQRQQAKMQWLQDQNQSNVDNLNSVRREARNKRMKYLKANIDDLELTVEQKISDTSIGASMTLRRVSIQEQI